MQESFQAASKDPSPPPCLARPRMSTADRLGSREDATGAINFVAPGQPLQNPLSLLLDRSIVEICRRFRDSSATKKHTPGAVLVCMARPEARDSGPHLPQQDPGRRRG